MTDDWKPGDLALCISDYWTDPSRIQSPDINPIYYALAPRKGSKWRVTHAQPAVFEGLTAFYLWLEGQPSNRGFNAEYFKKIDEEPEEIRLDERIPELA